jgi:hypothetical protein
MQSDVSMSKEPEDHMRDEYDFSDAVRGEHKFDASQGYTIRVHRPDGTIEEQRHPPLGTSIQLSPDVQEYFPDSASVNRALRALIEIMPREPHRKAG